MLCGISFLINFSTLNPNLFKFLKSDQHPENRFGVDNRICCHSNDSVVVTECFCCDHRIFIEVTNIGLLQSNYLHNDIFSVITTKIFGYHNRFIRLATKTVVNTDFEFLFFLGVAVSTLG